jgi:hypothetical protein
MTFLRNNGGTAEATATVAEHVVDRMVRNVAHGRFERSLSGLTAASALVTGAEVYLEHYKASFGNKWMWSPVLLTPPLVVAGMAGCSPNAGPRPHCRSRRASTRPTACLGSTSTSAASRANRGLVAGLVQHGHGSPDLRAWACKFLGCSGTTLRRLLASGKLHGQVLGPRNRRYYTRTALEAYLIEHRPTRGAKQV